MHVLQRVVIAVVFAVAIPVAPSPAQGQGESSLRNSDVKIYEMYRAWATRQQGDPATLLQRYREVLANEGLDAAEIDRRIQIIGEQGQALEIERWNRILTAPSPNFNTKPNAFLVEMIRGRTPGTALDVGMGQGRNAIYLAQQGWSVTGFDPADRAVAAAQQEARRLGVTITTSTVPDERFDFGKDKWDLIVLSYVGVRHLVGRVHESLKPGGLVVVEGFHRDATKSASIGGGVVFDTNELPKLFERLRIVRYEDAEATSDFGLARGGTRVVRLAAEKQ